MSEYFDRIKQCHSLRMNYVIKVCKELYPQRQPWKHPELSHGTALLKSEDGLNAYISAYGEMHTMKCLAALQNFPFDEINVSLEIVDWGCGQGIGSLCIIESIKQREKFHWLKKITLIEPSQYSLSRAELNVYQATNRNITVNSINKYLPGDSNFDSLEGVDYHHNCVIHIFSNILDVNGINLMKLADMVSTSGRQHFVVCIGPMNNNSYRIDQFCKIFDEQEYFSEISNYRYAFTSNTFHPYSCKTKCFAYNGKPLNRNLVINTCLENLPIYSDYDILNDIQNGLISDSLRELYCCLVPLLNADDIVLVKPKVKEFNSDIVIVRKGVGILLINMFDKDIYEVDCKTEKDDVQVFVRSITNIFYDLIKNNIPEYLLQKEDTNVFIKRVLFFAKNHTEDVYNYLKNNEIKNWNVSIYGNDLLVTAHLQRNLFFKLNFEKQNKSFSNDVFAKFMKLLTPKWHSYKQGKIVNLTKIQENLSKSIANKTQKISGVAGSGKTQVMATRAVNAQVRTGGDVLVLTFNITLAGYIRHRINDVRADFNWSKIHIDNYHGFIKQMAKQNNIPFKIDSSDNTQLFGNKDNTLPKYSAIFIDEVGIIDKI